MPNRSQAHIKLQKLMIINRQIIWAMQGLFNKIKKAFSLQTMCKWPVKLSKTMKKIKSSKTEMI